jgi:hypothetical protein
MSIRYCGICGSGWAPEFKFCPRDGTNLDVKPLATLSPAALAALFGTAPVASDAKPEAITGQRPLVRRPAGEWGFGGPEQGEVSAKAMQARAPAEAKPARKEPAFEIPDLERNQETKPARAPAEAAPRRAPAESPPVAEGPETRGRKRPASRVKSAPEVVRAFKGDEVAAAEARTPEPAPVHTSKKRRDAAAFSETAWFKRPIADAEIDAATGRVAHTDHTYRPDPSLSPTQRKRFSLRRSDEDQA